MPPSPAAADDHELIYGGFRTPQFAGSSEQLPDLARIGRQRERVERFGDRIEALDRVATEVAHPDDVGSSTYTA